MRQLSEEDVDAIVEAIKGDGSHACRFSDVEEADLKASVDFYKHFNQIMAESGSTFRKTIIILGVGGLVTIIGLGIVAQIKKFIPQ